MTAPDSTAKPLKKPKHKTDATLNRIINAAEKLFAEQGYEGTSLREIAAIVGIKEPSIYAHFANKEAIYTAVIDRALKPFYGEIYRWNHSELTLKELNDIPRNLMALHAAHPYAARILHREFCNPADRINRKVLEWVDQITDQSQQFISGLPDNQRKQINRNKVIANSIALTNITLGVFSTQGMQIKLLGDQYQESELFEEHVKVITKIFKSLIL